MQTAPQIIANETGCFPPQSVRGPTADGSFAARPKAPRDPRIDFFRGLALVIILYDHVLERLDSSVPFLLHLTPYHWGLFCAASIFIFVSGQAYGIVYGRVLDQKGFSSTVARSARRIGSLYVANFATMMALVMLIHILRGTGLAAGPLNSRLLGYETTYGHLGTFFAFARFAIVPDLFDILPMYMLFVCIGPFALWGLARRPLMTLAVSTGIYCLRRAGFFDAASVMLDPPLYLNPIPWHLIFVMGIAVRRLPFRIERNKFLIGAAITIVILVAFLKAGLPGLVTSGLINPPSWWSIPLLWRESLRPELPLVRVLYFALVAYLGATLITQESPFWTYKPVKAVMRLGRHSLLTFCSGILITWVTDVMLAHFHAGWPGALVAIAVGGVIFWVLSLAAENYKQRQSRSRNFGKLPL